MKKVIGFYWVFSLALLAMGASEDNPIWFALVALVNFIISTALVAKYCDAWIQDNE